VAESPSVLTREQVDEPEARVVARGLVLWPGVAEPDDQIDLGAHLGSSTRKRVAKQKR